MSGYVTMESAPSSTKALAAEEQSRFPVWLFWITILFQATGLRFIWPLRSVATIVNLLILVLLILYAHRAIVVGRYPLKIWCYYLLPGIMTFVGLFLNISLNVFSNAKLIGFFGSTLPWLSYLIIPAWMKRGALNTKALWRYYYYFMLWANIFGILEYVAVFHGGARLRVLDTPYGPFGAGVCSLFYLLEDGTVHYRYYSCFLEPGTLSMYLLPAISYAVFHRKYVALPVFLTALYLSDSLGGFISLALLAGVVSFVLLNRRKKLLPYALLALACVSGFLCHKFGESLVVQYAMKGNSAGRREENLVTVLHKGIAVAMNNPTGLKLAESTASFTKDEDYLGSNFSPGIYLQFGGIPAAAGYLACLIVSLVVSLKSVMRSDLSVEGKVVFSSIPALLPFIFQRSTIWESALFALLFAPSLIRVLGCRPFARNGDMGSSVMLDGASDMNDQAGSSVTAGVEFTG
jgi:hypothetical protein